MTTQNNSGSELDPGAVADAAIKADVEAGNAGSGGGTGGDPHIAVPEHPTYAIEGGPVGSDDREFIPGAMADVAIEEELEAGNAGSGGGTQGDEHIAEPRR